MTDTEEAVLTTSQPPPFATTSTKDLIAFGLENIEQRRRLVEVIVLALDACAGKPRRDGYLVDLLSQSLEGAVVQVCSAGRWAEELLKQIRAGRLRDFRRPRPPKGKIDLEQRTLLDQGRKAFRYVFPDAVARQASVPNAADVLKVEEVLRKVLKPLRTHRDKIVAHWDPELQRHATWGDLVQGLSVQVEMLANLWIIHTGAVYLVPTLSPHSRESTAEILAKAMQR